MIFKYYAFALLKVCGSESLLYDCLRLECGWFSNRSLYMNDYSLYTQRKLDQFFPILIYAPKPKASNLYS